MNHSSSIALAIAINQPEKKNWCIDGDEAVLMLWNYGSYRFK